MENTPSIATLHHLLDYDASKFTNAEIRLKTSLAEWLLKADSVKLKMVLQKYLDFVDQHVKKMEKFFEDEQMSSLSLNNPVMQALIEDADEKLSYCTDAEVKDACILAFIQVINHYKISIYGTATAYANMLDMEKAAVVFHEAEINEKQIDDRLSQLAEYEINRKAIANITINNQFDSGHLVNIQLAVSLFKQKINKILKFQIMKSDIEIQKDVMEEIKWEPFLNASEIGVAVKNGIVTLSGMVDNYSKKASAEKAAKRVVGVKAVAEEIQVGISPSFKKTDTEIAEAVLNALKWHTAVQEEKIKIKVEDGIVKLEGEVEWEYQRTNAKTAIENLSGVRSVINLINVKPKITSTDIKQKINAAFHRSATIDAGKVTVEVEGSKVTLTGKVRSFVEKEDAERAAWAAPGVISVVSKIEIEVPEFVFEE
jgi:osmotically-inducible protein OsmY/ferritin-like metal-binding protein YciE